jgi:hypothetical protein
VFLGKLVLGLGASLDKSECLFMKQSQQEAVMQWRNMSSHISQINNLETSPRKSSSEHAAPSEASSLASA